jgi:class I fructose-bisphosphate aldolase
MSFVSQDKSDQLRFFRNCHFTEGELENVKKFLRPSGTSMILPYDQFIEHDNRHLDPNPKAGHPDYIMEMAEKAGFDAVSVHYGVAKRYWSQRPSRLPLILKINGKTSFPSQARALSVHTSWVEDAVKIGAVGIGYTMYYGSPRQDEDIPQLAKVRQECEKHDLPLVIWAYPRGEAVDAKGGPSSSYALESAARMAMEMGATIIKSNLPSPTGPEFFDNEDVPEYFRKVEKELQELPEYEQKVARARRVVEAAQGVPVLFSGGSRKGDDKVVENAEICVEGGGFGFIYGRNMWKREIDDGVQMASKLIDILDEKANG